MVRTTGPKVLPVAPMASEVCSGCRPCQCWRHDGQRPVSILNWVMMGTMGGRSVWYCTTWMRGGLLTAKGVGLAVVFSVLLVGLLAETLHFSFQFGDTAVALATTRAGRLSSS